MFLLLVHLFFSPVEAWTESARIARDAPLFSACVLASGELLAISRWPDAGESGVYVYRYVSGVWSLEAAMSGENGDDDGFGSALALSRASGTSWLVVGAPYESSCANTINGDEMDNNCGGAGAVFVYTSSGGGAWTKHAYLKAANAGAQDRFGNAVAMSGTRIVVGADYEASCATSINGDGDDNTCTGQGAAYVFQLHNGVWYQTAYLKPSVTTYQNFAYSVAIDADRIVVGAVGDYSHKGSAFVFDYVGTAWTQEAHLKASYENAGDIFGWSVAVRGARVAVGAPYDDGCAPGGVYTDGAEDAFARTCAKRGAVSVFVRSDQTQSWTLEAYFKAAEGDDDDRFGGVVALANDMTLLIGAHREASCARGVYAGDGGGVAASNVCTEPRGAAYVFARAPSAGWQQTTYVKSSQNETIFGTWLAASPQTLVVVADAAAYVYSSEPTAAAPTTTMPPSPSPSPTTSSPSAPSPASATSAAHAASDASTMNGVVLPLIIAVLGVLLLAAVVGAVLVLLLCRRRRRIAAELVNMRSGGRSSVGTSHASRRGASFYAASGVASSRASRSSRQQTQLSRGNSQNAFNPVHVKMTPLS